MSHHLPLPLRNASFGLVLALGILSGRVEAQINPDISVIPRFILHTQDGDNLPGERSFARPRFELDEFEIAIQGYLNPYTRADVFLAKGAEEAEPFELEEVYATLVRGLPFDLNARLGKYLVEFGKSNTQHPHMWSYVTKPLSLERFLGDEGLNDLGMSLSILLPTGDIYSRVSADILVGSPTRTLDPLSNTPYGGIGLADTTGGEEAYAYAGRMMGFFPVGEDADVEVGLSALSGVHDPYRGLRFLYGNLDVKYKWKPDLYTSVTVQGEVLLNRRKVAAGSFAGAATGTDLQSAGAFLSADYQFRKVYSIGTRFDWTQSPYDAEDEAQALSLIAGFYPVEESSAVRLHIQRTAYSVPSGTTIVHSVALQFLFSLGPHKAHPF